MALTNKIRCNLINIQSVGNKTNIIKSLICDQNLDICMMTETWLRKDISESSKIKEMTPKSYNFYHIPRDNKIGGGVGILIKKTYTASIINQQVFRSFEYMSMKVTRKNKCMQLIIVYRPPDTSKRIFIEEFGSFLDSLFENRNILICGDFNIHMDNNADNSVREFVELLDSHDLENIVNEPTTLSNHIIDLVIQNKSNKIVSDLEVEPERATSSIHRQVLFSINIWNSENVKKKITFRTKRNFDADGFIDECLKDIKKESFECKCNQVNSQVDNRKCVNCFVENSKNIMASSYNGKCPLVEKQIIIRENAKWFNGELYEAKKMKRKMEDKWKRSKKSDRELLWLQYKAARNKYYDMIETNKKKYYNELFKSMKNHKQTQENLDELLGHKKEKILPETKKDHKNLANEFVDYFEEKTEKIYNSLGNVESRNLTGVTRIQNRKFCKFKEIDKETFEKVLSKMKNTYCENDPFPISDVKNAKNFAQVKELYFDIVNMSLTQAIFPKSEKLACVKPAYKGKGDKDDLSSYRPISNLSYLSKIIEAVVHKQSSEYLKQFDIIPEDQSAYRENHSTESTVCAVISDMTEIITNGKCGILVMLDLSAAFDTVDHQILLNDLKTVGFDDDVFMWFKSYLQDRKVTVVISNEKSEIKSLSKGVPQGSILGPLLFSIYTIELSNILRKHNVKFKIYADDTQFYFQIEKIEDATKKITEIMKDIKEWMTAKKLKLNEDKTECMLFGTAKATRKYEFFKTVTIGSSTINVVTIVRNLGVLIDNTLSMKDHILNTVKICNHHIRNIAFIRKYLNEDTLKKVICNHVLSRLDYCNSVYQGLPNYLLKKLQNVQNRSARLIKGLQLRDRITPALIELHWLPIKARVEYKILLLVHKALMYSEPKYLRNYLCLFEPETNVTVRHATESQRLSEPRTNCKAGERAFAHYAPRLYNRIPQEMKKLSEERIFKKELKTLLFTRCYDIANGALYDDYKT